MKTDKTQNANNLLCVFNELKTLDQFTKINVTTLLKNAGVSNENQTSTYIRRNYLLEDPSRNWHYRWNPEKEIPSDMGKFHSEVIQYYYQRHKNKVETDVPQITLKPRSDMSGYQTVFELLKECTDFTKINLCDLLKSSKVPYGNIAGKLIIEDFLETGPSRGVYRWRDQNIEIPNVNDYLQKIKNHLSNLPCTKNRANKKGQLTAMVQPDTTPINNSKDKIDGHLENVIQILQKASPIEAETVINQNDMFSGEIKMKLRRMYHDGSLNQNQLSDIVSSLLIAKPIENVTKPPVINQSTNEFDLKIQLVVKHTILEHYQKEMMALQMNVMSKAKQYGIEIANEELLQPIAQMEMSH